MESQQLPRVVIHYCTLCQWQLRAAWMAQELLSSLTGELYEVALRPGQGGVFEIWVDKHLVWERKRDGGFPGAKELKQRVRDVACPDKVLGAHLERGAEPPPSPTE
ncbi:MAG: SelT/SelW/SelH family protein [Marinagarivorans sp.]